MKNNAVLHFLRVKMFRLTSKRRLGMIVFLLSAPTAEKLSEARKHLCYWPYVKAFKPVDETSMNVLVFIGYGIPETKWNYYVSRSCELMNRCIRQYQALFIEENRCSAFKFLCYHPGTFIRPNDMLKPFCDFIDEMNVQE